MHIWSRILIFSLVAGLWACGAQKPVTPRKTFETYIRALQQKDYTTMKLLLSDGTITMHEKEAKAQGVTVDDIVKREMLFSDGQKMVELRDEKIDGDKATLQVKTSYGSWETLPFVREDGVWKIDKLGYANQMILESEDSERRLDELINNNSIQ